MDERQKLCSPDVNERCAAAEGLSLMGPDASFAAVELVKACSDDESVREYAVAALEEMGPPPAEAMSDLVGLLSDGDSLVVYWAITLIGRLGESAKASQDQLAKVLSESTDASVRERAAWAMGKIGADSDAAVQSLEQAAATDQPRLSRLAKSSLAQLQA